MQQESRIEHARRRLATTRLLVGAGSIAAFGALALVARAAHPGTHTASTTAAASAAASTATTTRRRHHDDFFGSASIASSSQSGTTSPQVASGGS